MFNDDARTTLWLLVLWALLANTVLHCWLKSRRKQRTAMKSDSRPIEPLPVEKGIGWEAYLGTITGSIIGYVMALLMT